MLLNGAENKDMKMDDDMTKGQDTEEEDLKKEDDDGKPSKDEKAKSGADNGKTKGQDIKEEDVKREDEDRKSSKDEKIKSGTNNTDINKDSDMLKGQEDAEEALNKMLIMS